MPWQWDLTVRGPREEGLRTGVRGATGSCWPFVLTWTRVPSALGCRKMGWNRRLAGYLYGPVLGCLGGPHCRSGQRQQPSPKDSWPFTSEACYEIKRLSNEQCPDLGDIRRILEPRVVAQPSNLSTQEVESGK